MIIGIGVDSVEIERFSHWSTYNYKQLSRIFSAQEIEYSLSISAKSAERFAVRFAAKEAFVKSLGTGFNDKVSMNDISIDNDDKGKPYYDINKKLDQYIQNTLNVTKYSINLSITDDREYANAIAIIERVT